MKHHLAVFVVGVLAACHFGRVTVFGALSGGVDAERTETHDLPTVPGERLELSTAHGSIEVRSSPGATAQLRATLRAGGRTKEEAQRVLSRYSIVIADDGTGAKVRSEGEPLQVRHEGGSLSLGAVVDYVVTLPEDVVLDVDTASGDIRAAGSFRACRLDTRFGEIEFSGGKGDVSVHTDYGDLSARDVAGGRVTLESGYGTVRLENVAASSLRALSKSGDIELQNGRAATIEIDTHHGEVRVRGAEGDVKASSRSGDVELDGVRGGVVAKSQYGRINVEGVVSGLEARSSSGDVTVRALQGSQQTTDWELASGYGEVTLYVPADFGCQLSAQTRYGDVECAFPVTLEAGKRRNSALRGVIGRGGRKVTLDSGSGSVALRQL